MSANLVRAVAGLVLTASGSGALASSAVLVSGITGVQERANDNFFYLDRFAVDGEQGYVFASSATANAVWSEPATGFNGVGRASADLATGKLGVFSSAETPVNLLGDSMYATSTAAFYDTMNFSIADAAEDTVTSIKIIYSVHGSLSGPGRSLMESTFGIGQNGGVPINLVNEGADAVIAFPLQRNVSAYTEKYHFGWTSFDAVLSGDRYTATVTYDLFGANPTLSVAAYLGVVAIGTAAADFGNTSSLHFVLPDHVTFSSSSGVFLKDAVSAPPSGGNAVPEPTTWAMLILGFGVVGAASRRRKWAALAA